MSPAKNKEDSSKKNQTLSNSKGVVIPIDKLANNSLGVHRQQEVEGPPEIIALLTSNFPEKGKLKALDIVEKREDNRENERKRQFDAFNRDRKWKFLLFIFVFLCFLGLDIYLYSQNHSQAANILTTAIVSLAIGFFGGRGYEKSQTP